MNNLTILSVKMTTIALFTIVFCAVMLTPQSAQAGYLDPGSGSTAVQWIIAGLAALGRIKRQFSDTVSKLFGK